MIKENGFSSSEEKIHNPEKIREIEGAFKDCGIENLKEEYPKIYDRILVMHEHGEHFEDAIEIKDIIKNLYDNKNTLESCPVLKGFLDSSEISKEQMMFCALVHDIGKTGPYKIKYGEEEERLVTEEEQIFIYENLWPREFEYNGVKNPHFYAKKFNPVRWNIEEFAGVVEFSDKERINKILFESNLFEEMNVTKKDKIIDILRAHVDNSFKILKKIKESRSNEDELLDDKTVDIVGMHHSLDGRDPTGKIGSNFPSNDMEKGVLGANLLLGIIDKYQASVKRGGQSHSKAMEGIEKKIKGMSAFNTANLNLSNEAREMANTMLKELRGLKEHLNKE